MSPVFSGVDFPSNHFAYEKLSFSVKKKKPQFSDMNV